MYSSLCWAAVLLAGGLCAAEGAGTSANPPTAAQPGDGVTETIHRAALAWLDDYLAKDKVTELVPAAEGIAAKLIAGGNLYAAGDPAFGDELNGRAGGLAATKLWEQVTKPNDVVMIGMMSQIGKDARYLPPAMIGEHNGRLTRALTVQIASHNWPQISRLATLVDKTKWPNGLYLLDTNAPDSGAYPALALDQMTTLAVGWALQAEVFAAASRQGKTLCAFTSIFEPGGAEFYDKNKDKIFLEDVKLKPIAPGVLGREYLKQCRRQIAAFLASGQAAAVRQAAARLAATQTRGGVIWAISNGHLHLRGTAIPPELTHLFFYGRSWEWNAPQGLRPGDTLLHVGYLEYPKADIEASLKAGADAVVMTVDGGPQGPQDVRVTSIRTCWEPWDGVVAVSGYPYKIIPSSAVVQTPQVYSLLGEAAALVK